MRSSTPLVSVCVATYNYGRFLKDCIESVLAQTFTSWELIICDDCSTDDSQEIIRKYVDADSRIRLIVNERRLGMNANIKKAAELGQGVYLKMLCSDDWLTDQCLEVLTGFMEQHPDVVLATSAEILSDEQGNALQTQFQFGRPVSLISGEDMLDRMSRGEGFGGNSSFFIRATAYRQVGGYDASRLYAADYDLAARLCRVGNYLHIDEPLFYGRQQAQSSSSQDPKKLIDVIDFFEIPDRIFQPRAFANTEWYRFQRITASLTARYLLNSFIQNARGEKRQARELRRLLMRYGNFKFGIPWLIFHAPLRLYRRIARTDLALLEVTRTKVRS